MTKKKTTQHTVLQEDASSVEHVLEQYHQLATNLHDIEERGQVEDALSEINALSENAQLAFVKSLTKERHTDAADVLSALYELGTLKSVRKEARRGLIQLEGARIYPIWNVPVEVFQVVDEFEPVSYDQNAGDDTTPYRFWKGYITDSLAVGEAQLLLCFEQEQDPGTVRVFGFLLEFLHDGVKDFFTRVESKRKFEKFYAQMSSGMPVAMNTCSLAEGREFVLQALGVNEQRRTNPHRDYRRGASLVNRFILSNPDA